MGRVPIPQQHIMILDSITSRRQYDVCSVGVQDVPLYVLGIWELPIWQFLPPCSWDQGIKKCGGESPPLHTKHAGTLICENSLILH